MIAVSIVPYHTDTARQMTATSIARCRPMQRGSTRLGRSRPNFLARYMCDLVGALRCCRSMRRVCRPDHPG